MKSIISLLAAIIALPLAVFGYSDPSGVWTYYQSAGTEVNRLFATPNTIYYVTLLQPYYEDVPENSIPFSAVHRYDRKAGELQTLTKTNGLTEGLPIMAEYNPYGKYLFLSYEDSNIDLVYDNGKIVNIHGLKNSDGVNDKKINSVTFNPEKNLIYVATNFGYFTINDKKGEISESRIYRVPLKAVAESGDNLIAVDGNGQAYSTPMAGPKMNWNEFTPLPESKPIERLMPLGGNLCGALAADGRATQLLIINPDTPEVKSIRTMYNVSYQAIEGGHFIGSSNRGLRLRPDGGYDMIVIPSPEIDAPRPMASPDLTDFWFATAEGGFYNRKLSTDNGNDTWSNPTLPIKPQGPLPFMTSDMAYHPSIGFLVPNHGINAHFQSQAHPETLLLSVFKDGSWTQYGLQDRAPSQTAAFANPNGIALDPDNPNLIYFGSLLRGLLRINLADASDILHLSRPDPNWEQLPGFVKVHEVNPQWKGLSQLTAPVIDSNGNLWVAYNDYGATNPAQLWVWSSEARKASTKASTYRPMNVITVKNARANSAATILPLKNSNIVVYNDAAAGGDIVVINHQGTLNTASDDRTYSISFKNLFDSDGQLVDCSYAYCMAEDPETGRVWVGTNNGIFSFSPTGALNGNPQVKQFKISRNDGTGLADYLLSGVQVNDIMLDPRNRKWVSTSGAGLVCVSADGSEIITSCTTENSEIPADLVYKTVYSPESQSMMVATDRGLAEYRPYNVGDGSDFESARVYPNPVRPEYLGYVTIDGLVDNSIVKITDSRGRMVRELGFAANGLVRWDICDINRRRVGSGIYYVMASTGPDDESLSKVAKILVIN